MNLFKEESADLYAPNTKEVADRCINETMKQLAPICQNQYEMFVKDMVDSQMSSSLNEPVTKYMLSLFRLKAKPNESSVKNQLHRSNGE